jgi:MFS family permease
LRMPRMPGSRPRLSYAWVIVLVCTLMMVITYGLMYSYSVFFKPLADYFGWDRATVSSVYSASLIIRGALSIGAGWLADRYGAGKVMAVCGVFIGLGLILSSLVTQLWQLFLTYALLESMGLCGAFGITTAVTSRWFTSNRGLALGLVSSGVGIGTLLIVPGAERLIAAFDWSQAFKIVGIAAGAIMFVSAFLLREPPAVRAQETPGPRSAPAAQIGLRQALANRRMLLVIAIFALIFFCTQLVMVHLVNYATDIGITPLVAATFVSLIGVISIGGRLAMGTSSDRLGIHFTLILCCFLVAVSLVLLVFTRQLWMFYLFAAAFGFAYGGEVPQIPLVVGDIFGTRKLATMMGLTIFAGNIGGALGPWLGGVIFDHTESYRLAFIVAAAAGSFSLLLAWLLKKSARRPNRT